MVAASITGRKNRVYDQFGRLGIFSQRVAALGLPPFGAGHSFM
jgi:hypothetical protein